MSIIKHKNVKKLKLFFLLFIVIALAVVIAVFINYRRILKNPEKAANMGQKGKARSQRFSVESMVAKLDALYTDLINNGN